MNLLLSLLVFFSSFIYADLPIHDASLLHHTWKWYSQSGEEGIIEEMLRRIGIEKGFFVEFGAADGIMFSNTRFLAARGWNGVFIESDPKLFPKLLENCMKLPNLLCLNEFVSSNRAAGRTLDEIADQYFLDREIDVLSIDIDGLDYLILEELQRQPKIICIESSGYWHPLMDKRIPDEIASRNLGQPLSVAIEIARKKGYEPVCFLLVNLFLVKQEFYHLFSDIKNDPVSLWLESWQYIGQKQPLDQRFIYERRKKEERIKLFDPFQTPPLSP